MKQAITLLSPLLTPLLTLSGSRVTVAENMLGSIYALFVEGIGGDLLHAS